MSDPVNPGGEGQRAVVIVQVNIGLDEHLLQDILRHRVVAAPLADNVAEERRLVALDNRGKLLLVGKRHRNQLLIAASRLGTID